MCAAVEVVDVAREDLLEAGAEVDARNDLGETPLALAAHAGKGYEDVLTLLIKHRADVNTADHGNATPIVRAAMHGSGSGATRLLVAGANMEHIANESSMLKPIQIAVLSDNREVYDVLKMKGAKPQQRRACARIKSRGARTLPRGGPRTLACAP